MEIRRCITELTTRNHTDHPALEAIGNTDLVMAAPMTTSKVRLPYAQRCRVYMLIVHFIVFTVEIVMIAVKERQATRMIQLQRAYDECCARTTQLQHDVAMLERRLHEHRERYTAPIVTV